MNNLVEPNWKEISRRKIDTQRRRTYIDKIKPKQ
jgi:hypothetical protein